MDCKSEAASHYAGCDCNEAHWQDQVARLTRERDETRERERLARVVAMDVQAERDRLAKAACEAESALATERRRRAEAEERFRLVSGPFFALAAELMPFGSEDEARANPASVLPYLEAWFERLKVAEEKSAAPPAPAKGEAFVSRQREDRAACPMHRCGESPCGMGCACEGACLACHPAPLANAARIARAAIAAEEGK